MVPASIDIKAAADLIGIPVEQWPGRCYEIACAFANHGICKGQAVYGHWRGRIHPKAPVFGERSNQLFVRHGWVLLNDGETVVDPTRWVFENAEPYVFIGRDEDDGLWWCHCGHLREEHKSGFFNSCEHCDCPDFERKDCEPWPYDEGGDLLRTDLRKPPPTFDPTKKVDFKAKGEVLEFCLALIDRADHWCQQQLFWLANLPYSELGRYAPAVYGAIISTDKNMTGFIPYDNRKRAEREFKVKL